MPAPPPSRANRGLGLALRCCWTEKTCTGPAASPLQKLRVTESLRDMVKPVNLTEWQKVMNSSLGHYKSDNASVRLRAPPTGSDLDRLARGLGEIWALHLPR
jgi:hypothetical protein